MPDTSMERTPTERGLLANAFTAEGRASRLQYLIYLMSYWPLVMILGLFGPLYVLGILIAVANYLFATIQRCHDIGLNGWWSLVLGLPGPNLALLAIPGGAANRYGEPVAPVRRELLIALVMVLLTIAACTAYYLYVFRPAIQAYETRNAIGGASWQKLSGESPVVEIVFTSPIAGSIALDDGRRIAMTYRARYRTLYLQFSLDGAQYTEVLKHKPETGQLEIVDGDVIIGAYGRQ